MNQRHLETEKKTQNCFNENCQRRKKNYEEILLLSNLDDEVVKRV